MIFPSRFKSSALNASYKWKKGLFAISILNLSKLVSVSINFKKNYLRINNVYDEIFSSIYLFFCVIERLLESVLLLFLKITLEKSLDSITLLLFLSKLLNNKIISSIYNEIPNFFKPYDNSEIFILLFNSGSNKL